jgi:RNA polymerase sigma-70 factor, ECF subfamily
MQGPDLPEVIQKAVAGDKFAFRTLVEKHQGFVHSLSRRFLNDRNDADDITQEVFIRLWKHLPRYRPEVKLTTWLYKITTNLCLDVLKSARWKRSRNSRTVDDQAWIADPLTSDQELLGDELKAVILAMSNGLTPKQKAVLLLRDVEGLEVHEVCEVLSMSAGNLKSNLYYARLKMSELITRYYKESKREIL